MLLSPQPVGFQGQMSNSLLVPKMSQKMDMLNSSEVAPDRYTANQRPPTSSPIRNNLSNQRKIRNAVEVLKHPQVQSPSRDFIRNQEETKNRCVQETQQSAGCFATITESSHLNFVIPCIPMHLSSAHHRTSAS
mmetsp:Transcript_63376/g.95660  ORF Transcript_63376/g.95660 Transcript_63376/m.95660 type:complete len:134 (-) Transcript_63376:144-545(-)